MSGLDIAITKKARSLDSTALEAALNTQFLFQIGVFIAMPMIMGFILEQLLLKVCQNLIVQFLLSVDSITIYHCFVTCMCGSYENFLLD